MAEGEQINTEQTRLDKIDKKIDKKVMVKGKDYAEIVIKKVDTIEEKLKSNFGIKEQAVLDSPKFKESKSKAFSDTFAILREIDEKNIDALTVKLDQKLKDIEKEFVPFSAEEVKITKFKNDLTDFNTYMEKRRGLEKSGKFQEAQNLTSEYQSKHMVATETASPIETANYLESKKYQEVKNTLGDSEKINELLRMAQGFVDQANEERKFEQQEGFRVGYMVQGSNIYSEKSAVGLPSDLVQTTDKGNEKEIVDLAAIVEINPEKGVRIVMTAACTDATRAELKEMGVSEGWVKAAVLRQAIHEFKMKFSHCEEGMTRCVTPKREGKSVETEAQAKALVEEANALKAKIEIATLMDKTPIASKRAIEALSGNVMSKDGKVSFTPKFLADFENLTIEQKKNGIKIAQDSLLKASMIEATEKTEDPVSKHFHLGREALQNGDLPGARFRFNQFLDEVSRQQDRPETKDMIVFAKDQIKIFNIASIKRLQKINDQLSDSKRYEALFKDHANERFLYNFVTKNKANLAFQLQQIEAGTIEARAQGASLVQRKEQAISATPIVGPDGRAPSMQEKDNSDKVMDAWNSVVYAEFSTGIESDKGKIQDEYLSAARSLRALGQPDMASGYFEAAMKEDIDRVRGSISTAQKEQMRTKIINENEKKRSTYETTIRTKMWGQIEEFNAKRPPEQQKPLEISATDLKALVDEAMSEGVEEKMNKAVMHGMEVANDKGELEKGSKKAWGEYESMMDVNDKWYIISDKEAEKIAEQVFINGVIMAISGGVGSLAAASVRAYMIANGIRSGLALGAAGFVTESTGFELANRALRTVALHEEGLFMPTELAKGIGQSMLMFGSISIGNKGWSVVSKASGITAEEALVTAGTTEKLLRQGADKSGELTVRASMKKASDNVVEESLGKITGRTIRKGLDWSGQLATEAAIFSATSDNSFIESAGDIIMLRIGAKLVSPMTGVMHDAGKKIMEEGVKKGQEKEMNIPVGTSDKLVGEVVETSKKAEPEGVVEPTRQVRVKRTAIQDETPLVPKRITQDESIPAPEVAIVPKEKALGNLMKDGKIDPQLQQLQERSQKAHEGELAKMSDAEARLSALEGMKEPVVEHSAENQKSLTEIIAFISGETDFGVVPDFDEAWSAIEKSQLTLPQKKMALATVAHILKLKHETNAVTLRVNLEVRRRLGVSPGERYKGPVTDAEVMEKQVMGELLAEKMNLPPMKGRIEYREMQGVLIIRCENNEDFGNITSRHPTHLPKGEAFTPQQTPMGISMVVIRGDIELSEKNFTVRHELQHILKQGSNDLEPGRMAYNKYKKTEIVDENGQIDMTKITEYMRTEAGDIETFFKDEILAFLRTHDKSVEDIAFVLHEKENGAYDYWNKNRDDIFRDIAGVHTELFQNRDFVQKVDALIQQERAKYRQESKIWLDKIAATVLELQEHGGLSEEQARDHLANRLMFVPVRAWDTCLHDGAGKEVSAPPPTRIPHPEEVAHENTQAENHIDVKKIDPQGHELIEKNDLAELKRTEVYDAILRGEKEMTTDAQGRNITFYRGKFIAAGGMGSISNVAFVRDGETKLHFAAIKQSHVGKEQYFDAEVEGAKMINDMNHPNIIKPLIIKPDFIIFESSSDARNIVYERFAGPGVGKYFGALVDAGRGIQELQRHGYFHGDVKEGNILMLNGVAKVIDISPLPFQDVQSRQWPKTPGYSYEEMDITESGVELRRRGLTNLEINNHLGRAIDTLAYAKMMRNALNRYRPGWKADGKLENFINACADPVTGGKEGMLERAIQFATILKTEQRLPTGEEIADPNDMIEQRATVVPGGSKKK